MLDQSIFKIDSLTTGIVRACIGQHSFSKIGNRPFLFNPAGYSFNVENSGRSVVCNGVMVYSASCGYVYEPYFFLN